MSELADTIVTALRDVYDPCCREREISVVDMGLLRHVSVDDEGAARVEILLTSGWCPFQLDLVERITETVEALPEVASAAVSIELSEVWSTERLSDDARRKLRFLPEPGQVADRDAYVAAHLGSPGGDPHGGADEEPQHNDGSWT